jgi:alpha-ketoglutarate-dependent taurine dioxygenase
MSSYSTSSLSPTFGILVQAHEGAGLPDPHAMMDVFEQSGALLLRGFPFTSDAFVAFSDQCCTSFSSYIGGGIRFRSLNRAALGAGGTLLSVTGGTQSFAIPLHGEMYYQKDRPDMLWFYCQRAPATRGQTTLADGRAIFEGLTAPSKELLSAMQLRYIRELGPEDWPTSFQTHNLEELHRLCSANDLSLEVRPDNSVHIEFVSPGINSTDGYQTFINNAILLWHFERALRSGAAAQLLGDDVAQNPPLVVRFDDGSELPQWLMEDIDNVAEQQTVEITWQDSDVLLVDNRRILHGRRKSQGSDREILVRLGNLAPTLDNRSLK